MTTFEEISGVIRLDNIEAKTVLARYNISDLESAFEKLSEPIKLSFNQRLLAKAFGFDVPSEVSRLLRLVQETIAEKEAGETVPMDPVEVGFFQQNLK